MSGPTLIQKTGRAAFWNAVMIPLHAALGLAFAVIVARRFGLYSGVYNVAMGVVTTVVMFTSVGIPNSLTKFLPEVEAAAGAPAVVVFLRRAATIRLALVTVVLIPMLLFAEPLAELLSMGPEGALILRLAALLIAARAFSDLAARTLTAFFGQFQANSLQLLNGSLEFLLVGGAVLAGYQLAGVFGMVVASGVATAAVGLVVVRRLLGSLDADDRGSAFAPANPLSTRTAVDREQSRFTGFAVFTFLYDLSIYFSDKAFAASTLAIAIGTDEVAIFDKGYVLAFMSVGLMVSSFRGVYRPMFAHLRARDEIEQLRRAFRGVSKAQLVILIPAGTGLFVLAPDYIPLLYGAEFVPSIPITQVFALTLYTATAFNLGLIWLSIDERYGAVLGSQSLTLVGAPLFVVTAGVWGLVPASFVLGGTRLVINVIGYWICRRDYGFEFPWRFAAKVGTIAAVMAALLLGLRLVLPHSLAVTIALTLIGAAVFTVGLRLARILGAEEIDLLERSDVPGKRWALAWLAPER